MLSQLIQCTVPNLWRLFIEIPYYSQFFKTVSHRLGYFTNTFLSDLDAVFKPKNFHSARHEIAEVLNAVEGDVVLEFVVFAADFKSAEVQGLGWKVTEEVIGYLVIT